LTLLLGVLWQRYSHRSRVQAEFERRAIVLADVLHSEFSHLLEALESIRDLYAARLDVERGEFERFSQRVIKQQPAIQGLDWIPRVPDTLRATFEASAQAEGITNFQFTERTSAGEFVRAGQRAEYFPVYFRQPPQGYTASLGFDLASHPARRAVLEHARDTGQMAATPPLKLLQGTGEHVGVLVFVPIYQHGVPTDTPAARQTHLHGFGLLVLRLDLAIQEALQGWDRTGLALSVTDNARPLAAGMLYVESPPAPADTFRWTRVLSIADRHWRLEVAFLPASALWVPRAIPTVVAIVTVGFSLTAMLSGYLLISMRRDTTERQQAEQRLREQTTLAALGTDIGRAVAWSKSPTEMLGLCTEAMVRHLDAAFARVWTLNAADNVLELQASAGMYTHLDGAHGRVPVGQFKIGLIAQERRPHLTNAVTADPRIGDKEWAHQQGMVAFAGYPLMVGDHLVGVIAMFARHPLSDFVLQALEGIANSIALGLEDLHARQALLESELRFRQLAEHIHEVFYLYDTERTQILYVSPAYEQLWGRSAQALYQRATDFIEAVYPEDRPGVYTMLDQHNRGEDSAIEYRIVRSDGAVRWILDRAFPFRDGKQNGYWVAGVAEDITERKQAEQMKSDFVSFVTHQLRTPLSGIKWLLELATSEDEPIAERLSYIQDAQASAARLTDLVNDLLDVSRLERGKMKIVPQAVQLVEVTRAVLLECEALVQVKDQRLSFDATPQVAPVWVDPLLIRQVILNLVSNATKFTPHGGTIAIALEQDEAAVRWTIHDSGIGIPPEAQRHIFEKFYRADNAYQAETEGTGLGLYIVRLILEQCRGRIWFESAADKGTTFIFTLPRWSASDASTDQEDPVS
jgi:PAS domain S-box-containing protein